MLRGLREASGNWIGKTVMWAVVLLLIVSFGIWGIGDMFNVSSRAPVAVVGSTEISGEQFRQIFTERLQQLSRQVGRPVTPIQARSIGFDQQLLGQLVAEAALDESTRKLGLNISNAELAKRVANDPAFRGITGEFDRNRFEQLLRQSGYTEQRFFAEQRKVYMRRQLALALSGGIETPKNASEALARYQGETRSIDFVTLTSATVGEIAPPSPEELEKYFEERKITFRAPEYRKLVVLALTPDEIAKSITVSDEEAKEFYDRQAARFTTPEKREVQQIVFPDEESAKAALEKIKGGAWFENIATERGLSPSDINLGSVTKSAIVDPAIAEAAFGLEPGTVSEPVSGRFGKVLVRVNRAEPEKTTPFADAAADIKKAIAADRARVEITKRRDKIEDELAGGARLEEAAQKAETPVRVIDAVDRSGRGSDGNPVPNLPQEVLTNAFTTDVGVENDPVQADGGFIWYEVGGITPARDRTLAEIKDRVETRWREDQLGIRLKAKADEIIEKIKAGKSLAEATEGMNLKIDSAKNVQRTGNDTLPQSVVTAMFRTAKDAAGQSDGKDVNERIVFKVTDITVPPYDAENAETKRMSDTLKSAIADELLTQYVTKIESTLGTTINRAALNQAISGGTGN
jgi:peptidyl-prolyl cis-trans isomerase D